MVRRIQGVIRDEKINNNLTGYKQVWNMGRAGQVKKQQKIFGINRPST